jgi:ATP-dependent RNA helicase RhlE
LIAKTIPVIDNHPYPLMNHNPVKTVQQQGRGNSGHARSNARVNAQQKNRFSRSKPRY